MGGAVVGAIFLGGSAIAAGGLGAAFTAGGLITAAARIGAGLIINDASTRLLAKKDPGIRQNRTESILAPAQPREIVYGFQRKGGVIIYMHREANTKWQHFVIAVASHQVEKIGRMYFDGVPVTNENGEGLGKYFGLTFLLKKLGSVDQTAIDYLVTQSQGQWSENHRARGVAICHVGIYLSTDLFPRGVPKITFDIWGKNDILDPRDGQRKYTTNAALCTADYIADPRFGMGAGIGEEDGIVEDDLIEAANICDEDVPRVGGLAVPLVDEVTGVELQAEETGDVLIAEGDETDVEDRYTCNGSISVSQTRQAVIEGLLTSMGGKAIWRGAGWHIQAAAYRMPIHTLTDDDVGPGGVTLEARVSVNDNFNGVRGQFISPENNYQPDDYPAYQSAFYLAQDQGVQRWLDMALPFTESPGMAQRLAKIKLERVRRQQTLIYNGKFSAWRVPAGETAFIERARWGFSAKPFEVTDLSLTQGEGGALLPRLTARETSAAVYSWTADEEAIVRTAPPTELPNPFELTAPGVPRLAEQTYVTRAGTAARVKINVSWALSTSAYIVDYQVEARRVADLEGNDTGDVYSPRGRTDGGFLEIFDVQPGFWEVRLKGISSAGVSTDYVSSEIEVVGLGAPPADIQGLTLQTAGGLAVLQWDFIEDADVRVGGKIEIRHSVSSVPSLQNSVPLGEVSGSQNQATLQFKPGAYLVVARDNGGNRSPNPAIVVTDGAQAIEFANLQALQAEPLWSGPKTNVQLGDGDTLELVDPSLPGMYEFDAGMDFGAIRRVRLRSRVRFDVNALATLIDDRTDPIDTWEDFDGSSGVVIDVFFEARTTKEAPSTSTSWSDWQRLDSTEVLARGIEFRARIVSPSTDFNILLQELQVQADEVI